MHRKKPWMPEGVHPQQVIDLYLQGYSSQRIVDELKLTTTHATVIYFLRGEGVKIRSTRELEYTVACEHCSNEFVTRATNRRLCDSCAPEKEWKARFDSHGITKADFERLLDKQSGLCDLCELPLPKSMYAIKVDHCHKQGHVRALLHHKCNLGLHFIEDDKYLANAIRYIERHRK